MSEALANVAKHAQVSRIEVSLASRDVRLVKKNAGDQFHFNLLASNGQVIASSETYETKAAALKVWVRQVGGPNSTWPIDT